MNIRSRHAHVGPGGTGHEHGHAHSHTHGHSHSHGKGHQADHEHGGLVHDHGHTHDELIAGGDALTSVGIDIGTSTTHLMFSQLLIGYRTLHSQRPEVLERKVIDKSSILLTPFDSEWRIDAPTIDRFLQDTFRRVGIRPEDVDTGAVIITGEAARKENARQIADFFSGQAGRFVCATAGPRLETIMAAHGSGAVGLSRETGKTLLNIDIGGGTTKICVIREGRIIDNTAINIGARLITFGADGRIARIERDGRHLLDAIGSRAETGMVPEPDLAERVARRMGAVLFEALAGSPSAWPTLYVIGPLANALPAVDGVVFSGGVSEYIYGRETKGFGDLGAALAGSVRAEAEARGLRIFDCGVGIRATVIGASQHSVQVSGETIFIPPAASLPMHNLRVFTAPMNRAFPTAKEACAAVSAALDGRDEEVRNSPFALAISLPPFRGYGAVLDLADGISRALCAAPPEDRPDALVFESNIAQVVGNVLSAELGVVCLDEVALSEMDFIDIGAPKVGDGYVPIIVKSLIFDV